jgi:hypothetical protein
MGKRARPLSVRVYSWYELSEAGDGCKIPTATRRRSRVARIPLETPRLRWKSLKRRTPSKASRTISIVALVAGVIMLDFGIQAVHVTSQSMLFAVRPEARSRLVGSSMAFYSVGSACGAIASAAAYAHAGWAGVCALGATISLVALLFWAGTRHLDQAGPSPGRTGDRPAY